MEDGKEQRAKGSILDDLVSVVAQSTGGAEKVGPNGK